MEYRKEYTKRELLDLRQWFLQNRTRFPKTIQLNPGIEVADVDALVADIDAKLERPCLHVAQSGLMYFYFQIQAKLLEYLGEPATK